MKILVILSYLRDTERAFYLMHPARSFNNGQPVGVTDISHTRYIRRVFVCKIIFLRADRQSLPKLFQDIDLAAKGDTGAGSLLCCAGAISHTASGKTAGFCLCLLCSILARFDSYKNQDIFEVGGRRVGVLRIIFVPSGLGAKFEYYIALQKISIIKFSKS